MQQQRPQKGRAVRQRRGATQRARRRRRMLIIFYLLLFLFLVVAAISLSLTVLFRISRIEVRNESIYTQEEILQACAISEGENLFLADVDGARGRIETQLPYTAQVTVERDFPSGITVTVGQATVSAALIQKDGTVLLIGADHKILEQVSAVPPGVLQVSGLQVQDPTPGYRARWEDEETASVFFALQQEMQEGELSPITSMDVGDLYRLTRENVKDGFVEYMPQKTKKCEAKTVRVPLHEKALRILSKYEGSDSDRLLPFKPISIYNNGIRELLRHCGIDRMVTVLDTHGYKTVQKPLYEVASSHTARKTFVGNLYKQVPDPNLIASMSGHVEGSRAFARYRNIDDDMKRKLVEMIN